MKTGTQIVMGIVTLALIAGCSSNEEYIRRLQDAQKQAKLSLTDSVAVAQTEVKDSVGVRASLLVDAQPVFSVGMLASAALKDVRVDIVSGKVLSVGAGGGSAASCPGAISLTKAIAIAESAAGGAAVAVEPDDDVACAREIQVLSGSTLWEVKVASDGKVLEKEESDENED